ncbi:MAG: hypothetical protein NXI04_16585 [Planctomycetaceae bacterium]|nr:hypothetical protein [Planctomycetaceae bacterium]
MSDSLLPGEPSENADARFQRLLQQLLDDDITADQLQQLTSLATDHPEQLAEISRHLLMSDQLSQYEDELRSDERFQAAIATRLEAAADERRFIDRVVSSARSEVAEQESVTSPTAQPTLRGLSGWIAAAVAVIVLVGVWLNRPDSSTPLGSPSDGPVAAADEPSDRGVAVLTRASGLVGDNIGALVPGATIPPGELSWQAGLLQLEFYGGATVIAEGPASLEILDDARVICRSGRLRAHVPEPARGFVVLAPTVELVDLGTEFGIDVATNGSTEVHVFDGKVELYEARSNRDRQTRRELNAGDAVALNPDGHAQSIAPRSEDFVTPSRLNTLTDARRREQLDDWKRFRDSLLTDDRIVAFFPFDYVVGDDRTLTGFTASGQTLEGAIVGCEWAEGRWPDKAALQFKRPGDRVRVSIPGQFESLTYSTWLRLDGLDRRFNSLILTDGFPTNAPHWQIRQDGRMILGVRHKGGAHDYNTDPIFDLSRLGQWVHLATVFDAPHRQVRHYVNGQLAAQESIRKAATGQLAIGSATIGNWSQAGPKHESTKIRNLNGRIDELIVFGEALSEEEIRHIYTVGRQ